MARRELQKGRYGSLRDIPSDPLSIMFLSWFKATCLVLLTSLQGVSQPEKDLTARLLEAKTEEEQKKILAAHKERITADLGESLILKGNHLFNEGSYPQALNIYNLAHLVAQQLKDEKRIATALRAIGDVKTAQGNYTVALDCYERGLKLAEALGDREVTTVILKSMGSLRFWQGNYAEALQLYRKSLKLAEESKNREMMAAALSGIGLIHWSRGEMDEALAFYEKSLRIEEQLNNTVGILRALTNIGSAHIRQAKYRQALQDYLQCLKLAEQFGMRVFVARALTNIGYVYHAQSNYEQALHYYEKSLSLMEQLGDKPAVIYALSNIGRVYYLQEKFDKAVEFYTKCRELAEKLGDQAQISTSLKEIGDIYASQRRYMKAVESYQQSLKLQEEIGDRKMMALLFTSLANVYFLQENYDQSVSFADRAVHLAVELDNPERLWEARLSHGKAHRKLGNNNEAFRAFSEAVTSIEKLRDQVVGDEREQQRFFENKLSPYHELMDLLIEQNNLREALAYAERAKARVVLDVLREGRSNISKAMTQEEQEQEQQLHTRIISLNTQLYQDHLREQTQTHKNRIAELNAQLQKARLEYEAFQTSLYASHPELKVQRAETQTQSLTLDEADQLVSDTQTALLEFVVTKDKTYLFVLTQEAKPTTEPGGSIVLKVYPISITEKELSSRALNFRKQLAKQNRYFQDSGRRLYTLLIEPARTQLHSVTTLCIVPDGALWELPFQALQSKKNKYLLEEYTVFYAPSLTVLREMTNLSQKRLEDKQKASDRDCTSAQPSERRPSRPGLLAFASHLAEAKREIQILQALYGSACSKAYAGAAAREDKAKSEIGRYQVVHFATHAILDDRNPMYSSLLLSPPSNKTKTAEDGVLEAWEVMKLNLQTDLAVLSACETARGRVGKGEGMIGMSWAWFVAGCPNTVVSQWKVNSQSTLALMEEFHRQLISNNDSSKAEALRNAALKVRKKYLFRHPFYWAGFVLIGAN